MIIMKFGGSSLANTSRIEDVAKIIFNSRMCAEVVVIVSAMQGVTDLLLEVADNAAAKNLFLSKKNLKILRSIHRDSIINLHLKKELEKHYCEFVDKRIDGLEDILKSVYVRGKVSDRIMDAILSYGERLSIYVVSGALNKLGIHVCPIEANKLIVTDDRYGNALPLLNETEIKINECILCLLRKNILPVISGFIGGTVNGATTTLGRGGSDYSATIIGYCLNAAEIWLWKDVDGAMTADPKVVKNARTISSLSYDEAAELSYFGAKVLHPLAMIPASLKNIPIRIKNTFHPEAAGTKIVTNSVFQEEYGKAVSAVKGLCLITVQSRGFVASSGIAAKLFAAISCHGINITFISLASSGYDLSFAVKKDAGVKVVEVLEKVFQQEILSGNIKKIKKVEGLALLGLIGNELGGNSVTTGKLFSALGNVGVKTIAIAQGGNDRNISCVISESDLLKALQSIHDEMKLAL